VILTRLHPIEEAVRARPREIEWVLFDSDRRDRRIHSLMTLCRSNGVAVRYGSRAALDREAGSGHQGAVARIAVRGYLEEEAALEGKPGGRFLLLLDEVQDPQNLGAVLRVAEGLGAGVVVPERGTAPLSEAVARASAGAVERVSVDQLPSDWPAKTEETRALGNAWLARDSVALLMVPSAIVPETFNVLLNPAHTDAKRIVIVETGEHAIDPRLLK